MYRFKNSIPLDYDRQGYIYFTCRAYRKMPDEQKKIIRRVAAEAGGEYKKALLDFVTTDASATKICRRYYISESTLYRIVRRFYVQFPPVI